MIKNFDNISTRIIIILFLFSLTTIYGCDGDDWGFDLFGTTPDGDGKPANLSGSLAEDDDGDVLFFEWVP